MRAESILIVDDEKLLRWSLMQELTREAYRLFEATTKAEALAQMKEHDPDLIVLDQRLPDGTGIEVLRELKEMNCTAPIIMLTAYDRSNIAVQAMKLGACDYLIKPVNFDELKITIRKALEESKVRRQLARMRQSESEDLGYGNILCCSPAMKRVLDFVDRVSQSSTTTVLITGESGTGKELVARAVHSLSERNGGPFMAINCSAVPENLIESELLGHEKGAFTDARSRQKGILEQADGGTVFLDEIGDMIPSFQVSLLRVIEEKSFRRIGGSVDINIDVRVIAATNGQLERLVSQGKFREDLFYRLNVARVHIPPLRERGDDIILLAEHFLQQYNRNFHKKFKGLAPETASSFRSYSWPGNVRELKNILERAVLLHDADYVELQHVEQSLPVDFPLHLPRGTSSEGNKADAGIEQVLLEGTSLVDLEKNAIVNALRQSNQNRSQAARLLKISRDTLRYRMKKYGIP